MSPTPLPPLPSPPPNPSRPAKPCVCRPMYNLCHVTVALQPPARIICNVDHAAIDIRCAAKNCTRRTFSFESQCSDIRANVLTLLVWRKARHPACETISFSCPQKFSFGAFWHPGQTCVGTDRRKHKFHPSLFSPL